MRWRIDQRKYRSNHLEGLDLTILLLDMIHNRTLWHFSIYVADSTWCEKAMVVVNCSVCFSAQKVVNFGKEWFDSGLKKKPCHM